VDAVFRAATRANTASVMVRTPEHWVHRTALVGRGSEQNISAECRFLAGLPGQETDHAGSQDLGEFGEALLGRERSDHVQDCRALPPARSRASSPRIRILGGGGCSSTAVFIGFHAHPKRGSRSIIASRKMRTACRIALERSQWR